MLLHTSTGCGKQCGAQRWRRLTSYSIPTNSPEVPDQSSRRVCSFLMTPDHVCRTSCFFRALRPNLLCVIATSSWRRSLIRAIHLFLSSVGWCGGPLFCRSMHRSHLMHQMKCAVSVHSIRNRRDVPGRWSFSVEKSVSPMPRSWW